MNALYRPDLLWQLWSVPAKIAPSIPFVLADGTRLEARLRRSSRARRVRLSLTPDGALLLTAPQAMSCAALEQALPQFLPWLERAWRRHERAAPARGLPQRIILPLPGLDFLVESGGDLAAGRRAATHGAKRMGRKARPLLVRSQSRRLLVLEEPGRLRLFGSVEDEELCALALRRWCRDLAGTLLPPCLAALALKGGFALAGVSIRDQSSRWGSCARVRPVPGRAARPPAQLWTERLRQLLRGGAAATSPEQEAAGRINLNWRALLLPVPLLEHLCWHELCHLRQMNHSPAYRAELARFSPRWPEMEKALNRAWRELPWWALPASGPRAGRG